MTTDESTNVPPGTTDRVGCFVLVEVCYLLVLFAIGLIYLTDLHKLLPFTLPGYFGSLAVGVPWFGALGAVMISLAEIVDQGKWESSLKYWHLTRPLVGSVLAIVSVLIFQAGILAVNSNPAPQAQSVTAPTNVLYYLIAFVVGYREEVFRALIKRLADVILTPGGPSTPPPTIRSLNPSNGPPEGKEVIITGSGFTGTKGVKFGATPAEFVEDSDSQITAIAPQATAGTVVSVTVTTKAGSVTAGKFTYEDIVSPSTGEGGEEKRAEGSPDGKVG